MSSDQAFTRIDRIFNEALKHDSDNRATFLAEACGDDRDLLREVESLLAATSEMGKNFLEEPILPLDDAPKELDEGSFVGVYRILREIGKGGMGKVYLATRDDDVYRQEVAVKILKRGLDTEEIVRRFQREREILARLEHRHIARILDGGTTDDGLPYFVMEYVEGQPIDRHCEDAELDFRARLLLFRQVCSAVHFAHQNLIVHRDLKPQNILVTPDGTPKLLDFGIAKLLEPDQALTVVGTAPMTPRYASPEQIRNDPITTVCDVYALGSLLYELLTGHPPHALAEGAEDGLGQQILELEPEPPSRRAGPQAVRLAGDLDSIVLRALEKDPRDRYASAEQLSADLDRHLNGVPVHARQATAGYRISKFVRRHRWGVTVVSAALVGVLGFGISMTVLRGQALRERERAELSREQAEEVTRFLIRVFQNPDPEVSKGEEVTARQILDKSVTTIDKRLEGEPETRAALMNAMGQAYLGLGLYDEAVPLLKESLSLRRESPRTRPEELATSLFNLAAALRAVDQNDEAIRLAREALEIMRGGGADDPSLARAFNNQALLLKEQGDVRTAEELYRVSLAMRIRLFGEEHEDVATAKHNLAVALKDQGKYDEAETLYRESLKLKIELYGDSPTVARTLSSLALLLIDRDAAEVAEPMLRDVVEMRRGIYDADHPAVGNSLVNLGFALRLRGNYEEAEILFGEAMQIFTERFGEDHSSVANVLRHQALLRLAQIRVEEAEAAARQALETYRRTQSEGHWRIAEAESVLGACLFALGRDEQAVPLLRRGYEALRIAKGDKARQTKEAYERLERMSKIRESLAVVMKLSDLGTLDGERPTMELVAEAKHREGSVAIPKFSDLGVLDGTRRTRELVQFNLHRALVIRQKSAPKSLEVASILHYLGVLAFRRSEWDQAAEYHGRALAIRQGLAPGSPDAGSSLEQLGILARECGDLEQGNEYFEKSLKIYQEWESHVRRLPYDGYLGPNNKTEKSWHAQSDVARGLGNLGTIAFEQRDLDRAAYYYSRWLDERVNLDDLALAGLLTSLGDLHVARGDLDRAAESWGHVLRIYRRLEPAGIELAVGLGRLGWLDSARGNVERAGDYLGESLKTVQAQMPGSKHEAAILINLGNLHLKRGNLDRAADCYERSLEIRQKLAPESNGMAVALHSLGNLAFKRDALGRATNYFEESLDIRRKLAPGSMEEAATLHALATIRRKQNQPRPALALFLQALHAIEKQVNRLGGSRDLQAGFRAERAAYYHDTIDLSLGLQQPEKAFLILERARAQSFLAQLTERELVFSDVPEDLEQQRRRIAHSYNQTQGEIAQLNPGTQAGKLETLRVRLQQQRWDYEDITEKIVNASPKLGTLRYPKPLDLDDARQALDPGTVMLSYSVGEKRTLIFALVSDGAALASLDHLGGTAIRVATLPIGEKELRSRIQRWNEAIQIAGVGDDSGALHSVRFLGKRLYEQLIEPVADTVAGSERLLIVPDGPLHVLPWSVLIREPETVDETGRGWQYLVEWKPVHIALSATVYAELKQRRRSLPAPGQESVPIRLAAFGDPRYPGNGDSYGDFRVRSATDRGLFDGWSSLPYTRQEVEQITALFPPETTRTYLGAGATEEAVKALGRGPRILHLATHAHLDDRSPHDSAVVFTIPEDSSDGRENGLLQVWEIFEQVRLEADLVVLSACASGIGKEQGGEGLIGLTRAFQFAGARSVVASLWNVRDRATAELMVRFYRHMNEGLPKDEALQAAQLELIRGIEVEDGVGGEKARDYSAPYYWAPFQTYGDWQ